MKDRLKKSLIITALILAMLVLLAFAGLILAIVFQIFGWWFYLLCFVAFVFSIVYFTTGDGN
jgi:1,4-dihydroxy-2-naphthoate octaprenyltransferase